MSDVVVSYKRENLEVVGRVVEALRSEGIGVKYPLASSPKAVGVIVREAGQEGPGQVRIRVRNPGRRRPPHAGNGVRSQRGWLGVRSQQSVTEGP
jgi:hypothetical protein